MQQPVENWGRLPLVVGSIPRATGRIGLLPDRVVDQPWAAASRRGPFGRARRLPHGAWRRPQPVAARNRFRLWPAATSNPSLLTIYSQVDQPGEKTSLMATRWSLS
jgi:hypothetical protein